jgi:hypothetical protein
MGRDHLGNFSEDGRKILVDLEICGMTVGARFKRIGVELRAFVTMVTNLRDP